MADDLPIPPPGFDELTVDKKVEYIEALWDRIAATPDKINVPDWHRSVFLERLAEVRESSPEGRSWGELRGDLLRELANRKRQSSS